MNHIELLHQTYQKEHVFAHDTIAITLPLKKFHNQMLALSDLEGDEKNVHSLDILNSFGSLEDILVKADKGTGAAERALKKFSTIEKSLVEGQEGTISLSAWLDFFAHKALKIAYEKEEAHALDMDSEDMIYGVEKKFSDVGRFLHLQLRNEINSNICTKGDLLYAYMHLGLATKETIYEIIGIRSPKKFIRVDMTRPMSDEEYAYKNAITVIENLASKDKKYPKSEFVSALNNYLRDDSESSVYDIFTWYMKKGHPNLLHFNTDYSSGSTFVKEHKHHLEPIIKKFEATASSANKNNSILIVDTLRKYYEQHRDKVLLLLGNPDAYIEFMYKLNYLEKEVQSLEFYMDIKDPQDHTSIFGIEEKVIDVRDELLFQSIKNAKKHL